MFELTDRDVFRLVEMFGSSDAKFMQVKVGDVEVVLSRREHDGPPSPSPGAGSPPAEGLSVSTRSAPGPSPVNPADAVPGAGAAVGTLAAEPDSAATPDPAVAQSGGPRGDLVTVTAPTLGSFYCAPRPDLPPYVEVGSTVEPESTVGLIEAMKVFTGVSAGVYGSVVEILVGNGEFVEFGQALFRLAPSAADGSAAQ